MVLHDGDIEKCKRDVITAKVPMLELAFPGLRTSGNFFFFFFFFSFLFFFSGNFKWPRNYNFIVTY